VEDAADTGSRRVRTGRALRALCMANCKSFSISSVSAMLRSVDRDQPGLPKFRPTNQEHAGLEVDIRSIEMERFVDPKAGHGQQAKQRGICPPPEVLGRRQGSGALDQRDDVLITIAQRR
jgi:hypothetical protein